jgi:hypothetical protein
VRARVSIVLLDITTMYPNGHSRSSESGWGCTNPVTRPPASRVRRTEIRISVPFAALRPTDHRPARRVRHSTQPHDHRPPLRPQGPGLVRRGGDGLENRTMRSPLSTRPKPYLGAETGWRIPNRAAKTPERTRLRSFRS